MKCNLRCRGCSVESYKKDEDLPKEVWDRVLDEAKSLGIYFITVQGGETFVRKDMLDIYASHPDMYFQVYSNGTLIDKKMAKCASLNISPMIYMTILTGSSNTSLNKRTIIPEISYK